MPMILALFAAAVTTADRTAIMAPVDGVFTALAAGDGQALLSNVWGKGGVTVANENEDGPTHLRQMDWEALAKAIKPSPEVAEETLSDPILRLDGDIAMVWGRYTYKLDGKIHHCGMDHFQLTRVEGQWKVTSLAWTVRATGCEPEPGVRKGTSRRKTGRATPDKAPAAAPSPASGGDKQGSGG